VTTVEADVPYFSQWESPELVGPIIRGELAAEDDPRWAESGAATRADYAFWSWRACGMACLRTVLASWRSVSATTVGLGEEVLEAGGYRRRPDGLDGLIYAPFTDYVRTRWGIVARAEPRLEIPALQELVRAGHWAMVSVNPRIRRPADTPPSTGGHLVLVHGAPDDEFVFHNPSGDTPASQRSAVVRVEDFKRFYAGRGIVLTPQ
jgi:hypothetical protein